MTGRRNIGFTSDDVPLPPNQPPPGVPLGVISSYAIKDTPFVNPVDDCLPEHTYLAPRVPGYNTDDVIQKCQRENVYDALGKYRDSGEAMKKANLVYDATEIKKPHERYTIKGNGPKKSKKNAWCMPFFLVIIGLLALGAFIVTLLQFFGMLKCGRQAANVASNTGSQQGQGQSYSQDKDLALKLKLMEDNITALKIKMLPQEIELLRLQNITLGQQIQIQILQDRLNEEETKNKKLNSSVEVLNNMHQILETTTNIVNKTLSARIDELQQQVNNQNTKVNGMDVRKNITDLTSMIANEAKFRQSNDSLLRSELASKTRVQAEMIGNLSASLDAVNRTTLQTIKNTEDLFYQLLNLSVQSLQVKDQSISNELMALNSSLSSQIRNISLTPGPQGPPGSNGAGNLTACYHVSKHIYTHGPRALMYLEPPANTVITGVFCYADVVGVRFKYLTTYNQPHCECYSEPSKPFNCYISAWLCPKTS